MKTISNIILKTKSKPHSSIKNQPKPSSIKRSSGILHSNWKTSLHLCVLALAGFGLSFCGSNTTVVGGAASPSISISQVDTTSSTPSATAQIEPAGAQVQARGFLLYHGELALDSLSNSLSNITAETIDSIELATNVVHIKIDDTSASTPDNTYNTELRNIVIRTNYNIHAYFLYADGFALSPAFAFSSPNGLATLHPFDRNDITDIADTTANAISAVVHDGGDDSITYGHVWSTSATALDFAGNTPSSTETTSILNLSTKTATEGSRPTGVYTSRITDLTASTPYYIRAYVTNDAGTVFSSLESMFTAITGGSDAVTIASLQVQITQLQSTLTSSTADASTTIGNLQTQLDTTSNASAMTIAALQAQLGTLMGANSTLQTQINGLSDANSTLSGANNALQTQINGLVSSLYDFNTLSGAGNESPYGIWSDGTTMWVVDPLDLKIYAYNLSTKARDAAKDFNTLDAAGNMGLVGYGQMGRPCG